MLRQGEWVWEFQERLRESRLSCLPFLRTSGQRIITGWLVWTRAWKLTLSSAFRVAWPCSRLREGGGAPGAPSAKLGCGTSLYLRLPTCALRSISLRTNSSHRGLERGRARVCSVRGLTGIPVSLSNAVGIPLVSWTWDFSINGRCFTPFFSSLASQSVYYK